MNNLLGSVFIASDLLDMLVPGLAGLFVQSVAIAALPVAALQVAQVLHHDILQPCPARAPRRVPRLTRVRLRILPSPRLVRRDAVCQCAGAGRTCLFDLARTSLALIQHLVLGVFSWGHGAFSFYVKIVVNTLVQNQTRDTFTRQGIYYYFYLKRKKGYTCSLFRSSFNAGGTPNRRNTHWVENSYARGVYTPLQPDEP